MKINRLVLIIMLSQLLAFSLTASPPIITWEDLSQHDHEAGEVRPDIQQLTQTDIQIAGFIVPIELGDFTETVREFLLVPNPLACIHVPPPPPNQMIYVKMDYEIPLDMDERGIYVTGRLSILDSTGEDDFFSYEMSGKTAKKANIAYEDPFDHLISM